MCNLKKKLNKKERRQFYLWLLGITVICVTYLFFTSFYLYKDKTEEERYWTQYLTEQKMLVFGYNVGFLNEALFSFFVVFHSIRVSYNQNDFRMMKQPIDKSIGEFLVHV